MNFLNIFLRFEKKIRNFETNETLRIFDVFL